jgi:hypothetical protein
MFALGVRPTRSILARNNEGIITDRDCKDG